MAKKKEYPKGFRYYFYRAIGTIFPFYIPIKEKNLPPWVKKAEQRWYHKQGVRPYDKTKMFYGNTFKYRIFYYMVGQGQTHPYCSWKARSFLG